MTQFVILTFFTSRDDSQAFQYLPLASDLILPDAHHLKTAFALTFISDYLTVKKPGEFAAPIQCLPLFKYGLRFDPNLYYLYDSANPSNGVGRFVYPVSASTSIIQ